MAKEVSSKEGLLRSVRVLDLTDDKGYYCGKLLGDLGADVIKIEPPSGDPAREIGPFYHDSADPEKSLFWFAYNANKRGITLNIGHADGQNILKQLLKSADILVESYAPGHMASLGLGYDDLARLNPELIMVSVTPFGQSGPYKDFKGSDLVCTALSGFLSSCGDPDRAPLRISFPQAFLIAGAEAAVAAMIAYHHRRNSGRGQYIDISAQQAEFWSLGHNVAFWDLHKEVLGRVGQYRTGLSAKAKQRQLWPCKDGYISFQIYGARFGAKTNRAVVEWMKEENMATDFLLNINWNEFDMASVDQNIMDNIEGPMAKFFLSKTMDELEQAAIEKDIIIFAVNNFEKIANHPQLKARGYWQEVEHPELNDVITYPAAGIKLSAHPMKIYRRAPQIGEHNEEIYIKELKIPKEKLVILKQAGAI
jgi:crotonobetainyl-CoA:carnitine CoA-transferase CaiB-like acyl-CoA transferase